MATTVNVKTILESFPAIPKHRNLDKLHSKKTKTLSLHENKDEAQNNNLHTTRRLALGIGSFALIGHVAIGESLAEDNGYWITGPIPVPSVTNKITNEDTGTRSFLKKGIYIADIGPKGRMIRLRRYAFDLLALGDLIGQDAWNYVRKYLRIKSTFMYYDFDEVISAAPVDDKKPLTELANRLFDNVEKLEDAVKKQNLPQTKSIYQDTTSILQEVMTRMA